MTLLAIVAIHTAANEPPKVRQVMNKIHRNVGAIHIPLYGKRIPAVLNKRLAGYQPGEQQFDYPMHRVVVQEGSKTVNVKECPE